jgi:phosphoglycerate dehydrogenase-like enzyme
MGAKVIYTARGANRERSGQFVSLAELLSAADVVSLHVPLTAQTAAMIDESAISRMKRGSVLVNTARGGLVDYDALYRALASGHLRGAGLDVFACEPVDTSHPLFQLRSVVFTPHVAWFTVEMLGRGLGVFAENCRRLRDGEPLLNRVV